MRWIAAAGVLLLLLAASPALRAEDGADPDAALRAEARSSVLIPWSEAAKTADLHLSEPATAFLDLWLDFCRSKHARRTHPNPRFQGSVHAEWEVAETTLRLKAAFVNLEIARAALDAADGPPVIEAVVSPGFAKAVRVEGDDDRWLRLWGVMLATEVATRGGDAWTGEAMTRALGTLRAWLVKTFDATAPVGDGTVRRGSLESEREIWLLALRATGCPGAAGVLRDLHAKLRAAGRERGAQVAAGILAACPGEVAEAFVLEELASGDWERQRVVLSSVGKDATPALIERIEALARGVESDERAQLAFAALHRAAGPQSAHRAEAVAVLQRLLEELPDDSERKVMAAMALVQCERADGKVVCCLRELVEKLEAEGAPAGRIEFLKRMIERAQEQCASAGD